MKICLCTFPDSRKSYSVIQNLRGVNRSLIFTWKAILSRCYGENQAAYKNYGNRGIKVCSQWIHDYEKFLADVGLKPKEGLTLDRIDNDKGYCPHNVRWAGRDVQKRNTRTKPSKGDVYDQPTLPRGITLCKNNWVPARSQGGPGRPRNQIPTFTASVTYRGKTYLLGRFNTLEEAYVSREKLVKFIDSPENEFLQKYEELKVYRYDSRVP